MLRAYECIVHVPGHQQVWVQNPIVGLCVGQVQVLVFAYEAEELHDGVV